MALPREVGDMIYEFLVESLPRIVNVSNDRVLGPMFPPAPPGQSSTFVAGSTRLPLVSFLPSLAYVNETVYEELVPILLQRTTLKLGASPDFDYLENFFETLPEGKGWEKVTNLTLVNLGSLTSLPGRATEVMDTITHATHLQVLVLGFALQDFYLPPDWPTMPRSRDEARAYMASPARNVTADYLMNEYQFGRLFWMDHLKRVILKIDHRYFEITPWSNAVLGDLKDALVQGFGARPGVISVTCDEIDVKRPGISVLIVSISRA